MAQVDGMVKERRKCLGCGNDLKNFKHCSYCLEKELRKFWNKMPVDILFSKENEKPPQDKPEREEYP